jgi:hypothetical protein
VAFGETEATGLVLLAVFIGLAAAIAVAASRARKLKRKAADTRAAVADLQERARIGAIRHKDFDRWFAEDARRRERVGLPPLNREEAKARRFDPTYELSVPAPRRGAMARKKEELKDAVARGEEPASPPEGP